MDTENRLSFVASLGQFITDCDDKLTECLGRLEWNRDQVKKKYEASFVSCPLNPNHKMPAKSLENHLEDCAWISEGYTLEEKASSVPSSEFYYTDATTVHQVNIDKPLLNQIVQSSRKPLGGSNQVSEQLPPPPEREVPRTANRAVADFSADERWAIYDYVVAQGRAANKLQKIKLEDLQLNYERRDESHTQKSMLETLAEQRDYRRRRQSYRAKNVHITKKSYTEVMKEVIENHMEILLEMREEARTSAAVESTRETTPAPSRDSSRDSSRARENARDWKPPSPIRPSGATRSPPRDSRRDSRERGGGTRAERHRRDPRGEDRERDPRGEDRERDSRGEDRERDSRKEDRERGRRDRSYDDESRHRRKRRHSDASKQSDGKLSETKEKPIKEESSSHRHHHHKKKSHKSHKSHKRHHLDRSKD